LSLFFIQSPPRNDSSPHTGGLAEGGENLFTDPPRLGFRRSRACQLSLASG
jgi:hypothetical protein